MTLIAPDPNAQAVDLLVMGAGAIGCYIGGCLAAQGVRVMFVGRPRVVEALAYNGLRLSDCDGGEVKLSPSSLLLGEEVPPNVAPTLVLLTVKTGDTAQAAAELARALAPTHPSTLTPVISFQNGIGNAELARHAGTSLHVLRGMVPFNVAQLAPGYYHRGTSGELAVQRSRSLRPWLNSFRRAGLPLVEHDDMAAVLWSKLLLNLNNPVNALSGLPLREELLDAGYRRVVAALMDEALAALEEAMIEPAQITAAAPHRIPALLRLPTPVFKLAAKRMLKIDAQARSSMADDLALGRRTEVDAICGEVVRLAAAHGRSAPLNARMQELVEQWRPEQPCMQSSRMMELMQVPVV